MKKLFIVLFLMVNISAMKKFSGLISVLRQRCDSVIPVEAFSCTYENLKETVAQCLGCFKYASNQIQRMDAEKCLAGLLPAAFAVLPQKDLEVIHRMLIPHFQPKYSKDPLYSPDILSLFAALVVARNKTDHSFIISLAPEGKEPEALDASEKLLSFTTWCMKK